MRILLLKKRGLPLCLSKMEEVELRKFDREGERRGAEEYVRLINGDDLSHEIRGSKEKDCNITSTMQICIMYVQCNNCANVCFHSGCITTKRKVV